MGLWQSQMGTLFLIELKKDFSCRIQVSSKLLKGSGYRLALRNDDFCFDIIFFKKLVFAISYSTKIMAKPPLLLPRSPWLKTRKSGLRWRIITSWSYILIDDSKSGRFHYLIRAIFPYVGKCLSGRRYRPWLLSCLSPVCLYLPPCVTRLVFQSRDR